MKTSAHLISKKSFYRAGTLKRTRRKNAALRAARIAEQSEREGLKALASRLGAS